MHLTLQIPSARALMYSFLSISLLFIILNEKNLSFSPGNLHRIPNRSVSPRNEMKTKEEFNREIENKPPFCKISHTLVILFNENNEICL